MSRFQKEYHSIRLETNNNRNIEVIYGMKCVKDCLRMFSQYARFLNQSGSKEFTFPTTIRYTIRNVGLRIHQDQAYTGAIKETNARKTATSVPL